MGLRLRITALLTLVTLCTLGAVPAMGQQTALEAPDRLFLIALRQANVWLMPISREAPSRTTNESVQQAAKSIFDEHARLDTDILRTANEVSVVLPNDPNNDQQARIIEMTEKMGEEHDRAFATMVRAAQGALLVHGAQVRATTRNGSIRTLAHLTVHMLTRTMTLVENTGLVNPNALPLDGKKAEVNAVRIIADNTDPADRELLTKLRLDTLWQAPISREAADRGADAKVRKVSNRLAEEHTKLSQKIYDIADRMKVVLPDEPTAEQKSWANAISKSSGPELDRNYANLLRAADGSLIALVAQSRATTRSPDVRAIAQSSLAQLLGHMSLLESTGLVKSSSLVMTDTPPTETKATGPTPVPAANTGQSGALTGIIVLIVAAAGTLWLVRAVGHRGGHRR